MDGKFFQKIFQKSSKDSLKSSQNRCLGVVLGGLGVSWGGLGASWGVLGRPGGVLGRLGIVLGPSCGVLGRLRALLGSTWDHLEAVLGPSWGVLARLGASWVRPGSHFRRQRSKIEAFHLGYQFFLDFSKNSNPKIDSRNLKNHEILLEK